MCLGSGVLPGRGHLVIAVNGPVSVFLLLTIIDHLHVTVLYYITEFSHPSSYTVLVTVIEIVQGSVEFCITVSRYISELLRSGQVTLL